MSRTKCVALLLSAALSFGARGASAALTSSEKAQVKDFVARGSRENAARVRSLVVRTDLTADESIAALSDALAPVAFDEVRAVFVREMLFGATSVPSRPLLATAATRGLLARAETVYQRYVGGLDHEPRAIAELSAIYAFLDVEIANAGKPTQGAHDPSAGITAATYDACAKALGDHIEQHSRWLEGDGAIAESVGRVRAQAQVALLDMMPDGLTRRVDAADRLRLGGARRKMLADWGILLADAGKLDEPKAEAVRQVLAKLPGARADLELLYAGDERGALRARGLVGYAGGGAGAGEYPFGEEVTRGAHEPLVSAVAHDLAVFAAKRALDNRGELRAQAEHDATAAQGDPQRLLGRPRAPSIDHVVGAAIQLLVLDAPRAIDLAFARYLGGHPESAALLSDAIGALAAFATPGAKGTGPEIELGKGGGASMTMGAIRLAPNGVALGFSVDGHAWSLERGAPSYAVAAVKRDGAAATIAFLPTARMLLREGAPWSEGGYVFGRLRGNPRAGTAPSAERGIGPTVKLAGSAAKDFDAIGTPAPGDDFELEGDLSVQGGVGGLAVRASNGRDAVRGIVLLVAPGGRTVLAIHDDAGAEVLLAAPIDPSPAIPVHVKITVKGLKIDAVVGPTTLHGTLPATVKKGEVGLLARRGATVEIAQLSLRTP